MTSIIQRSEHGQLSFCKLSPDIHCYTKRGYYRSWIPTFFHAARLLKDSMVTPMKPWNYYASDTNLARDY